MVIRLVLPISQQRVKNIALGGAAGSVAAVDIERPETAGGAAISRPPAEKSGPPPCHDSTEPGAGTAAVAPV